MKRLSSILLCAAAVLASCSEVKEAGEYDNWQNRNEAYTDSLASVSVNGLTPEQAAVGQPFRILSFSLQPDGKDFDSGDYVYCRKLQEGAGTVCPMYTDSIAMNYRGRLIPSASYPEGYVFDQSFKTPQLDPTINVARAFQVSGLVNGMITALQHMHEGDIWRIWIPSDLAYGKKGTTGIPAYSTVIFDVNLTEIAKTGTPLSHK